MGHTYNVSLNERRRDSLKIHEASLCKYRIEKNMHLNKIYATTLSLLGYSVSEINGEDIVTIRNRPKHYLDIEEWLDIVYRLYNNREYTVARRAVTNDIYKIAIDRNNDHKISIRQVTHVYDRTTD